MKAIFGFLLLTLMIGCSTYNQSFYQPETKTSGYQLEVEKISDQEISGEASSSYIFGFIKVSGESEFADGITYGSSDNGENGDLKSAAAYDAIKKNNCSVLIAPRYVVKTSNSFFYRSISVTVTGYPGRYKTVKKLE